MNSLLARVRSKDVSMDEARRLVRRLYSFLLYTIMDVDFDHFETEIPTSMIEHNPKGVWKGPVTDYRVPVVVTAVARGGLLPGDACIDELALYGYKNMRLDCLMMNRTTDPNGHVTGVAVQGRKTGNSVKGAIVLYPDCMVATGGSMVKARDIYEDMGGSARRHIVASLICTPKGAETIWTKYPDTIIYTVNMDLELDDHDYILPGAGDMGNKLNGPSDLVITGLEQQKA